MNRFQLEVNGIKAVVTHSINNNVPVTYVAISFGGSWYGSAFGGHVHGGDLEGYILGISERVTT